MIRLTPNSAFATTNYALTFEITEKLCKKYCVSDETNAIMTVTPSVVDTNVSNGVTYSTIQFIVSVNYLPKGSCKTCGRTTNTFIETAYIGGSAAASITATSTGLGFTQPAYVCTNNCNLTQGITGVGTITLTFS